MRTQNTYYGNSNINKMSDRQLANLSKLPSGENTVYFGYPNQGLKDISSFLYVLAPCYFFSSDGQVILITSELLDSIKSRDERNNENRMIAEWLDEFKTLGKSSEFAEKLLRKCNYNLFKFDQALSEYIESNNTVYTIDSEGEFRQLAKYDLYTAGTYKGSVRYRNASNKGNPDYDVTGFTIYKSDVLDKMRKAIMLNFYIEQDFEWDVKRNDVDYISFEEYALRFQQLA